jgi:hypothetical protein
MRRRVCAVNDRSALRVDWCSHEAARYAVEHWHYSRCMPSGKTVKLGVWENRAFVGCVIFGSGSSPHLGTAYGLSQLECCELVRIALKKHATPVTKIMSISVRMLVKEMPGLRLIVSFADPNQGHIGGVYQGGNWAYCGTSNETTELYVNGKWRHMRGAFYQKTSSTPYRVAPGKHRYLLPLDDEMRRQIEPLRKPYPKRAGSADSGTSPDQGGRGGATPTPALSSTET